MKRNTALVALALVGGLAGCGSPAPAPSPTATQVRPTPKPEPSFTPEPLAIPECEALVPLSLAREQLGGGTEFLGEQPAAEYVGREGVPSLPVVLATAIPTRACYWGVPLSDGAFSLVVAGITGAERATLQGELTAAGYSQSGSGTVASFGLTSTHVFARDAWILCDGPSLQLSAAVTGSALEALRAANPTLGL